MYRGFALIPPLVELLEGDPPLQVVYELGAEA